MNAIKKSVIILLVASVYIRAMQPDLIPYLILTYVLPMKHTQLCAFALVNKNLQTRAVGMAQDRRDYLSKYIEDTPYKNWLPISERYIVWHKYGSACAFLADQQENKSDLWCNLTLNCLQFSNNKNICYTTPIISYAYTPVSTYDSNVATPWLYPAGQNFSKAAREGWARYKCWDERRTELSLPFFDHNNNAGIFSAANEYFIKYTTINTNGKSSYRYSTKNNLKSLNYHINGIKDFSIPARPPKRLKQ